MKARLLRDGERQPARHFAIEEAILRSVDEGRSPPTLRIRRSVPALWIGLYQRPEEEIDLEAARRLDVPVMRRPNPGGAVYQDEGTLCYSCFFPKGRFFSSMRIEDPSELYAMFGNAAIGTLCRFGAEAALSPVNDVTIGGRKVYGSAQVEHYSAIAHSGTFLLSCDIERMGTLLRPSALKYADRGFISVRERVVNLSEALGRRVDADDFAEALVREIALSTGLELAEEGLNEGEIALAEELLEKKYGRPEWTYREASLRTRLVSRRSASGVMTLAAILENDIIVKAELRGDFLVADGRALEACLSSLAGRAVPEAIALIGPAGLPVDIAASLEALVEDLR